MAYPNLPDNANNDCCLHNPPTPGIIRGGLCPTCAARIRYVHTACDRRFTVQEEYGHFFVHDSWLGRVAERATEEAARHYAMELYRRWVLACPLPQAA